MFFLKIDKFYSLVIKHYGQIWKIGHNSFRHLTRSMHYSNYTSCGIWPSSWKSGKTRIVDGFRLCNSDWGLDMGNSHCPGIFSPTRKFPGLQ